VRRLAYGAMRPVGGFGRFLAAAGSVLAVAACGTAAHQASAASQASAARTDSPATSPATAASPAMTPTPTPTPKPKASVPPPSRPRRYGNPDGHAVVPLAGRAVSTAHPDHVIGDGAAASCTSAAVVQAVAMGGIITFNCGPQPVTITMTQTANIVHGDLGALTIENPDLNGNPSGEFQNAPGIFDSLDGHDVQPTVIDSAVG
jgi:hypothetical protein